MSWGLANTVPLQDFQKDPEDLIYTYLGTNWSITSPPHLDKTGIFLTTNPADMINRPNPGNRQIWIWVSHWSLESGRSLFGSTIGTHGLIQHNQIFNIHVFTSRLMQGLIFPDLGIIARELERLIYQYQEGQITQIQQFTSFNMLPIEEASPMGESFAGMYRVTCQATAQYQKYSIL